MTCQTCGATIVPGTTQCAVCGTPVPTEPGTGIPSAPPPGAGIAGPPQAGGAPAQAQPGYGEGYGQQGYQPAGPQPVGSAPPIHCRTCNTVLAAGTLMCPTCHQAPMAGTAVCWHCGGGTSPGQPNCFACGAQLPMYGTGDQKQKLVVGLLALLLCGWGIHHFYLGNTSLGVTMLLLTIVGWITSFILIGFPILLAVSIWSLVDGIRAFTGSMTDAQGRPLV